MIQPALPKPSGDFEWVQESWGAVLRCRPLAAVGPHLFSTQALRLTASRDDHPLSWAALGTALGVSGADLVRMRQVHCADVFDASQGFSEAAWPEADIAISDEPDVAVSVRAADCVPILLGDVHNRAVAAIHAGWKGTAAGAALAAVRQGILKGLRGPRGGYELARERRRITAGDVVRAAMLATGEDALPPVPEFALVDAVVEPVVKTATEAFLTTLDGVTIDELCRRAEDEKAVPLPASADFAI